MTKGLPFEIDYSDSPEPKEASQAVLPFEINYEKNRGTIPEFGNALLSAGIGAGQGGLNVARNVANAPTDFSEWGFNKPLYERFHSPDIEKYAPNKEWSGVGRDAIEEILPLLGAPEIKGAHIGVDLLAKMLAGSAENENRQRGFLEGAVSPLTQKAVKYAYKTPWVESQALRKMNKATEYGEKAKDLNLPMSLDFIRGLEHQLGQKKLAPSAQSIGDLMAEATQGDYKSYRALKKSLGDTAAELRGSNKGFSSKIRSFMLGQPESDSASRLTASQLEELKRKYVEGARSHMIKSGHSKLESLDRLGDEGYSAFKRFQPYRNVAIASLAAGTPAYHLIKPFLHG